LNPVKDSQVAKQEESHPPNGNSRPAGKKDLYYNLDLFLLDDWLQRIQEGCEPRANQIAIHIWLPKDAP
jgi:hypothetical protein